MGVTINDVAKAAGVSRATVSRVFNKNGYVSKKSYTQVMQAVKQLGYSPNAIAVGLSKSQTNIIGFIVPEICISFFSELYHTADKLAQSLNYHMILCNSDYSVEKERNAINDMLSYRVCGIIIVPVVGEKNNKDLINKIHRSGTPVICVDRELDGVECDGVYTDNLQASYNITRTFLCQKIYDITLLNYSGDINFDVRLQGAKMAMKEFGLALREEQVLIVDKHSQALDLLKNIMKTKSSRFAIVSFSPDLLILSVHAAVMCKKDIPHDLLLAGYDELGLLEYYGYKISWGPFPETIGATAIHLLKSRLDNNGQAFPNQRVIHKSHMDIVPIE